MDVQPSMAEIGCIGLEPRADTMRLLAMSALISVLTFGIIPVARSGEPNSARDLVEQVDDLLWGRTMTGALEMRVQTPRWTRTLAINAWIERPRRSFIRITSPAKEAGTGSLRIGSEMWNYLPKIERIIKIPPAMMLQPWMGSDFTNDDLVKESSRINDYRHEFAQDAGQADFYIVDSTPLPNAGVIWGRIRMRVRRADSIPLDEQFFDDRGALVRVMTFSNVRTLGGRTIPTTWTMQPVGKQGNSTTITLKSASYDGAIDAEIFTQRNLRQWSGATQ